MLKNSKKYILGFGFYKGPLNLNNNYIKSSSILQITKLKNFFIKKFWWEKNWDDVNWLFTLKYSQFENCEFF